MPSLFLSAQHLSGTASEGLGTDAVIGVGDVGGLETGAERGNVKRFGTGGEGWAMWKGNQDKVNAMVGEMEWIYLR